MEQNEQTTLGCLVDANGREWMVQAFDSLPPEVRAVLRDHPFNLCAACVSIKVWEVAAQRRPLKRLEARPADYLEAIRVMEGEIRRRLSLQPQLAALPAPDRPSTGRSPAIQARLAAAGLLRG